MPERSESRRPVRVLFVCLGNICRSPLAEGLFRHLVEAEGLAEHFEIDSAGTGAWHVGERPDARMCRTASRRGLDITGQRARRIRPEDLHRFDHVLVMDRHNRADVLALASDPSLAARVRLFREFDPEPGDLQVPDPYTGGREGFEHVYEIAERTSRALLEHLRALHHLEAQPAER